MATDKKVMRRSYSAEFKAQVVAQCDVPGASVAKVAMSHGINANVVHGWRQLAREAATDNVPSKFIAVSLPLPAPMMSAQEAEPRDAQEPCVQVELHRGNLTLKLSWPASAAVELAAWTRELLR